MIIIIIVIMMIILLSFICFILYLRKGTRNTNIQSVICLDFNFILVMLNIARSSGAQYDEVYLSLLHNLLSSVL